MQWWRESMETVDDRLAWWEDAWSRCFIHWGAHSNFGGVWEGEAMPGYAEHLMRHFRLYNANYKREVVAWFPPHDFDADGWVRAIKDAGMRYVVITAKHHDGFAILDSPSGAYDVTDFGRDPAAELKAACARHGLPLGFYYAHAQDWHHPDGTRADWQFDNPAGRRPLWWRVPENQWHVANVHRYFDVRAVPRIVDLIEQYDPAIPWFDTPFWAPPEVTIRAPEAAREAKPDLIVNSRAATGAGGNLGDYVSTPDKPALFYETDGPWESIPTTNESDGWHAADHSHKDAGHFEGLLSHAAARGGNVLMNLGPKGDGTIKQSRPRHPRRHRRLDGRQRRRHLTAPGGPRCRCRCGASRRARATTSTCTSTTGRPTGRWWSAGCGRTSRPRRCRPTARCWRPAGWTRRSGRSTCRPHVRRRDPQRRRDPIRQLVRHAVTLRPDSTMRRAGIALFAAGGDSHAPTGHRP